MNEVNNLVDIDDVLELLEQGIDISHLVDHIDGYQVIDMNAIDEN